MPHTVKRQYTELTVNTLIWEYTLEYKAPDDDAGNTGQIVIRTVTVMPFEIRSLNMKSFIVYPLSERI